jgi:hypothetical protein
MSEDLNLKDLKKFGKEEIPPKPASLIETFRAIGYSLPGALADIIDNSISAGAKNVWVNLVWKDDKSVITIRDDGSGMTETELVEALRPGTHNPLESRNANDLGRFGLGLKTASFSQCRILTVISKKKEEVHTRAWNLDFVEKYDKWQILDYVSDKSFQETMAGQEKGTLVIWENMDRVIKDQHDNILPRQKFFEIARETEHHLSMVFHRYIESNRLNLWINDLLIKPWDPFLKDNTFTMLTPTEQFAEGKIKVTGYVLPHPSNLNENMYNIAGGVNGWHAQQGFYIYRKDRLLVAGDWLQLFKKYEHTKLARIMIEMDTKLDLAWQLDIRKSRAIPPRLFTGDLERYAKAVIDKATEVFRHRGKSKQRKNAKNNLEFAWIPQEENGREFYKINREHGQIKHLTEKFPEAKDALEKLFRLLEISLPIPAIVLSENVNADRSAQTALSVNDEEILVLLKYNYANLLKDGLSKSNAKDKLSLMDPFIDFPHLLANLK